ncbi:MAG: TonB-dependent receptor domain-containing protein [Blastocatellia bacterium]
MTHIRARRVTAALCLFLFSLHCFSSVSAQNPARLSGRVTDTNAAITAGATIALIARDNRVRLVTVTDANGAFRFERVAPGEYLLEAQAPGFARIVRAVTIDGAGQQLDLALPVAAINEEIIVTAAGTAQPVDEVTKAVTVIDARQIEMRDEYSLAETLRITPGLRVTQRGGPGSIVSLQFRGQRSYDTSILVDGLRFRDAADTQGSANGFSNELKIINSDRIEILRGSGSSLYGTNAIGGVINLVTDQGGGPLRGQLQLEGGTLGLFRARAQVAGGALDDRIFFSGGFSELDVTRGVDGDDRVRNTGAQGLAGIHFTPNVTLSARIFASNAFAMQNESPARAPGLVNPTAGARLRAIALDPDELRRIEARGLPLTATNYNRGGANFIPSLNDPDFRRRSGYFNGALHFTRQLGQRASYRLSYQRVDVGRTFNDGPRGVGAFGEPGFTSILDYEGDIDLVSARTDLRLGSANTLTAGYEFERERYADYSAAESPAPTPGSLGIRQRSQTFYIQNQARLLADRLQLSLAFRTQSFDLSAPQFGGGPARYSGLRFAAPSAAYTGDGSIAWFFRGSNTKLRAHLGNGYRAPSLYERFGAGFFGGGFTAYGDPRLKPERSLAVDAGIDQMFWRGRGRVGATVFYTRLQNIVAFGSLPPGDPFNRPFGGYLNQGGGLARGVELSAQLSPTHSTDIFASYTHTNADQRTPNAAGYLTVPGTSNHLATFVLLQRLGRRMDLTLDVSAISAYSPSFPSPSFNSLYIFDGYTKADLGAGYTLPLDDQRSIRFYGKVDNVLNRRYYESGFRMPGAVFVGGATYKF